MNDEIKDELEEELDLEPEEEDLTGAPAEGEDDLGFEYDDEGNVVIPADSEEHKSEEDLLHEEDEENGNFDDESAENEIKAGNDYAKEDTVEPAEEPDEKDAEIARLKRQIAERDSQIRDTLKSLGADENEGIGGLERLAAEASDLSVEEYRKQRAERLQQEEAVKLVKKQRFEEKIRRDLEDVQKAYPETKAYKSVFELPNFAKFSKFRDAGLTPEEAYIAANPKGVMASVADATKQQARNLNNKNHLRSNVPKGSKDNSIVISKKQMAEYKELFPNLSNKEIVALHKQTMKK